MAGRLAGKRAIVTGGDSGIGRAVAVAFAREGASSAIVYLDDDASARETVALCARAGGTCVPVKADVGREDQVARLFAEATARLGGLDVLVSNAAVEQRGKWETFALADWERILRTNLTGAFLLVRAALAGGHLREGGKVIVTGSIQGLEGSATDPAYAASKGGLTRSRSRSPSTSWTGASW
jgi:NAD(P)-dependent dehydrogenase (short-subunit alcohol dehydrogenase family)